MPLKGPLLQTAVFCEMVIEDKNQVLSLIRIIDRIVVEASGPNAPEEMPAVPHQMTAVLSFKSGSARGRTQLRLVMEKPDTDSKEIWSSSMHAESPDRGQNFVFRFPAIFDLEGVYWFHVYVEDDVVTSMPLTLQYVRQASGTGPSKKA